MRAMLIYSCEKMMQRKLSIHRHGFDLYLMEDDRKQQSIGPNARFTGQHPDYFVKKKGKHT